MLDSPFPPLPRPDIVVRVVVELGVEGVESSG
jgi:hypothetical protein